MLSCSHQVVSKLGTTGSAEEKRDENVVSGQIDGRRSVGEEGTTEKKEKTIQKAGNFKSRWKDGLNREHEVRDFKKGVATKGIQKARAQRNRVVNDGKLPLWNRGKTPGRKRARKS